jgi:hypothetical protein
VADGTRTHDKQNHNLLLYQLNYSHHKKCSAFIRFLGMNVNEVDKDERELCGVSWASRTLSFLFAKDFLEWPLNTMEEKRMKNILMALLLVLSGRVWAYGVGLSAYPMTQAQKMVSAEATAIFSDTEENSDGGVGMQVRYSHKFSPRLLADAGVGLASGDRSSRLFVGADYELYPDYMKQPRVSLKGTIERAKENGEGRSLLTLAPIVSKGFSFWGHEAFPFASLPVGLSLEGSSNTYQSMIGGTLGIMGRLPIQAMQHLTANFEINFDLKDSYNGIFFGVGYPL